MLRQLNFFYKRALSTEHNVFKRAIALGDVDNDKVEFRIF